MWLESLVAHAQRHMGSSNRTHCPLHQQADSQPLDHQGCPWPQLLKLPAPRLSAAVPSCASVCAARSSPDGTERGKGLSCFHVYAPPPPSNLALLFLEIVLSHVSLPRHGRWPLPGSEKGRIPVCPTSHAFPRPTLAPKEWEKPDGGWRSGGGGSVGHDFLQ